MFESISDKLQVVFKKLRGRGRLTESNIKDALREVRLALLEADVNYKVVKNFLEEVKRRAIGEEVMGSILPAQKVVKIVHEELVRLMGPVGAEVSIQEKPSTIMLVGLQGCGKTTACAKLGYFFERKGKKSLLIPADTRRPAAREQLEVLGKEAGVVTFSDHSTDVLDIVRGGVNEARKGSFDVVLVDTGGRLHIDDELMNELLHVKRVIKPQEILLVVDAMTGQDAVREAEEFERRLGIDGVVLTKLDGDARGGAAISVKAVTGKPIKFVGVGERINALEVFSPERIASRILGMGDVVGLVEKVENLVTEKERKKWERKIAKEGFNLEDLLTQLELSKKMGSVEELVQMVPGGKSVPGEGLEGKLQSVEAIIRSMTVEEKSNPDIIDGSRRRRIAAGSGTSVQEVNALLRQFNQMKKLMKSLKKSSMKGALRWQLS